MPQELGYVGENLDLLMKQGLTFGAQTVTFKNPDNSPVDLTGATIRGKIKTNKGSITEVASLDVSITDAVNGVFTFGLDAATTQTIDGGKDRNDSSSLYVWDMEMEDVSGNITPIFYGVCRVLREVTT